jgi:hypothetical protein
MTRSSRRRRDRKGQKEWPVWWRYAAGGVVAAVAVGALIAVAVVTNDGGGDGGPLVVPTPRPDDIPQNGRVLGVSGAPVAVVEYADFQ